LTEKKLEELRTRLIEKKKELIEEQRNLEQKAKKRQDSSLVKKTIIKVDVGVMADPNFNTKRGASNDTKVRLRKSTEKLKKSLLKLYTDK
jgi:hypothetical protein